MHDAVGSASHAAARAIARHAPEDFAVALAAFHVDPRDVARALGATRPELVLLLAYRSAPVVRAALSAQQASTVLVTAVQAGWPDDLQDFFEAYEASDFVLLSNEDCWNRLGRLPRTAVARWGFDETVFDVRHPVGRRRHVILWSGPSEEPDRTGYSRFLEPIRQELLTYWGFGCELLATDRLGLNAPPPDARAAWFNTGTIFVCASRAEGTPTAALEAAACGCTIVSTRVGCLPELIVNGGNGYLVERDADALLRGIGAAAKNYERLARRMQSDIRAWRWSERAREFVAALRAAASSRESGGVNAPETRPDLSREVTVFVTSIGAPSYAACRELLRRQDCVFALDLIEGVRPLSSALQQMLDRCRTPYYVQVDEDMLLFPHAVRTLYERLSSAPDEVAIAVGRLYDVHLDRYIQGIKIARHGIARGYPWAEEPIAVRRLERIEADGYRIVELPIDAPRGPGGALGLHMMPATPAMVYDRYMMLERLRQTFPRKLKWMESLAPLFLKRVLKEGREIDVYALRGVLAGVLAGPLPAGAELRDGTSPSVE
jgi:hypothetical protein